MHRSNWIPRYHLRQHLQFFAYIPVQECTKSSYAGSYSCPRRGLYKNKVSTMINHYIYLYRHLATTRHLKTLNVELSSAPTTL